METGRYHREPVETMERDALDQLIDERTRYTVAYASDHSAFYRQWFREHRIDPAEIRTHEDLLHLPLISGADIRAHQPPIREEFEFRSAGWEDWERFAEKYARVFVSQGFGPGDRIVICASYGMNVGANTMTLAARDLGI